MRFLAAAILLAFPVDSLVGSPFHRVSSRRLAPTRRLPPLRSLVPAPSTVQGTDEFKGKVHELGAACKTAALVGFSWIKSGQTHSRLRSALLDKFTASKLGTGLQNEDDFCFSFDEAIPFGASHIVLHAVHNVRAMF